MASARTDVRKFNQDVIREVIRSLSQRFTGQQYTVAFQVLEELWRKKLHLSSSGDDEDEQSDDEHADTHIFHHSHQLEWQPRSNEGGQYPHQHTHHHQPPSSSAQHMHHPQQHMHHQLPQQHQHQHPHQHQHQHQHQHHHHHGHQQYASYSSSAPYAGSAPYANSGAYPYPAGQHHQQMHQGHGQRSAAYSNQHHMQHPHQHAHRGYDEAGYGRPAPYMDAPTWVSSTEEDSHRGYQGYGRGGPHLPQNDGAGDESDQESTLEALLRGAPTKRATMTIEFIPQVDGKHDQSRPQQQQPFSKQPMAKHQYSKEDYDDEDEEDDEDEDEDEEDGSGNRQAHNPRDRNPYAHGMAHHPGHSDPYQVGQQLHMTGSLQSPINAGHHTTNAGMGSMHHQHHSQHYMGQHIPGQAGGLNSQAQGFVASQPASLSQLPGPPSIHNTPKGNSVSGPGLAVSNTTNPNAEGDEDEGSELGSSYDNSSDDETITYQLVLCQYERVTHARNKWRCNLKDGVMQLNRQDYVFHKCLVELQF